MGNIQQINIKSRKYYFFNDLITIKDFDSSLLKIEKKSHKMCIYYIGNIIIKNITNYENINSVNQLYLIIGEVDGYIEENNGIRYLTLLQQIKTKKYYQNTQNFGMKLNIRFTQ